MMIAIDYDATYTADPDGWDAVMVMMRARGHEFVCITGRDKPPPPDRRQIPAQVICAGAYQWKSEAAAKAGIKVDVWIDDMPGTIEQAKLLDFSEPPPFVEPECDCHRCIREKKIDLDLGGGFKLPLSSTRMILCKICGNKRCPHASDHDLACTNSNEPGQPGSIYEKVNV